MLRSLKWAYDLGVRQERVRIASHLKNQAANAVATINALYGQLNDPKIGVKRKEDIAKRRAVEQQVLEIIGSILEPNWEQSMTAPIMFPNDLQEREK